MQIELFGCTSAGKSSLAQLLLRSCGGAGIQARLSEEFVLRWARLDWVRAVWARRLLVDLLSGVACLTTWGSNRAFYRLALRTVSSLPPAVGWPERLNILRNVFKKTGIREIIRARAAQQELVVMDEGTLQTAHYLFVQRCAEPDPAQLMEFLELVPLPDAAIYLREDEETLIRRTIARGHKRIPSGSHDTAALFVKRALCTLEKVASDERVRRRLILVDSSACSAVSAVAAAEPEVADVLEIVRTSMAAARPTEAN